MMAWRSLTSRTSQRVRDSQDAALALNHRVAHVGSSAADKRYAARALLDTELDVLGASARLAIATACENHPLRPHARGW